MRIAVCLLFLTPLSSWGADWSRFRGENGNGASDDKLPLKWAGPATKWSVNLPGEGNGSPIVCGGKVYLQTCSPDGSKRGLACLDATSGQLDWHTPLKGSTAHTHKKNSLASSTPACDGERVYAVFWDGADVSLYAFDLKGKQIWEKKLGGYVSQHGPGFSPMVANGKVIVNYDQDGTASVVAFDGKTGEQAWSASRKAFRACYSTPYLRPRGDGKSDVVVSSTAGLTGYDPDSGNVTWNWDWSFDGMALRTVGSPIDAGNLIVAISGDGGGSRHTVVVDPKASGGKPTKVWEKKKDSPYVPMPVVVGETLYWITDAGMAMAIDLKSGKELWKERALSGAVSASLVHFRGPAGERLLLAISETGKAVTIAAKPDGYDKVADNDLKAAVFATPAISNGRMYIRAGAKLVCVGK
jgi:outer membrane protein assembly factor BamB